MAGLAFTVLFTASAWARPVGGEKGIEISKAGIASTAEDSRFDAISVQKLEYFLNLPGCDNPTQCSDYLIIGNQLLGNRDYEGALEI